MPATWRVLAVVLVLPGAARAQTPPASSALTLDVAIARAREANPTIAAARLARTVRTAELAVARERPNPEITYEDSRDTPRQSVGVSVPVELGGKRQSRIGVANAAIAVADAELAATMADVENDVRRAFFALASADEHAVLAGGARDLAARARDAATARVAAGDAPRLEQLQAELAFADADNAANAAIAEAAAARISLNVLIGDAPGAPVAVAGLSTTVPLPSLEDALTRAGKTNAGLLSLDRQIDQQMAQRKLTRALAMPDLTLGTAVTYDAQPEFKAGWRVDFGATLPIFSHPSTHVLVEDATLARLRAERAAAAASVAGTVASSLTRASAARDEAARYQSDILPRVADIERMAQDAYQSGQTGLAALLQSLQAARDVRLRAVDASLAYQTAVADLEHALGAPLTP
jgi:cobalt-zinc-cadmium efflux system outer membrane protein